MMRLARAGVSLLRRPPLDIPADPGGEAMVLLHGIGSDAATWDGVMDALPPAWDVLAWDAPGYGPSEPLPVAEPVPADYAGALAQVLDALGIGRVVLAGHSLGTLFAAAFAARHPARVARLALLSPALGYGVPPGAPLPETVQARMDDLLALGPRGFAEKRAARLVAQLHALPGVRRAMAAVRMEGYAQALRALAAGELLADAARLDVPVLVAVGEADVVTPPAHAEAVLAALPGPKRLVRVPGAGHALPQEEPALVARLLATGGEDG